MKTAILLSILLLLLSIFGWLMCSEAKKNERVQYALPEHPTFSGPVSTRISF